MKKSIGKIGRGRPKKIQVNFWRKFDGTFQVEVNGKIFENPSEALILAKLAYDSQFYAGWFDNKYMKKGRVA